VPEAMSLRGPAALECLHSYSLIHDDKPVGPCRRRKGHGGWPNARFSGRQGRAPRSRRRHRLAADENGSIIFICNRCRRRTWQASPEHLRCLNSYGRKIGLAFQIADDILDHTATEEFARKRIRREAVEKGTIVDILGLAGAKAHSHALAEAADSLAVFGDKATMLRNAARFIVERQH
jgi:farnesyl diphosphate synthase